MFSNHRFLASLLVAATLVAGGCATTTRDGGRPESRLLAEQAVERARQGDYAAAAALYRSAAESADRAQAHRYRLEAAGLLLDAGDTPAAEKLLASLPEKADDEQARRHRAVAWATIALQEGRLQDAANLVEGVTVTEPGQLQRRWLQLMARLAESRDEYLAAARARSRLDAYLAGAPGIANREALWRLLENLDVEALETQPAPADPGLEGWMRLVAIAKRHGASGSALKAALGTWVERFPGHPGALEYLPRLEELALVLGTRPRHVAVLLPKEGPFARAGAAVRDGIVAAWLQDAAAERPRLSFLPEAAPVLWQSYNAALEGGAELVIGPLSKEAVAMLAAAERLPLPTLALNYLEATGPGEEPATPPPQLFQFGLSPEAEAREVALRAWLDGHQQALVLTPDSAWGARVAEAFSREWTELGGLVAERRSYGASPNDMSAAVAELVNVDVSDQRGRTLRGILARDLELEPRPRQDAHLVFLAASTGDARQLRPQLRFHRAGGLPVYSTSHVNPGRVDTVVARDLEGIRFADMPWMVESQHPGSGLQQTLDRYWPQRMERYGRLFALGVDAYRLAGEIQLMHARPATRVDGVTGRMGLDPRRRVQRELTWARFDAEGISLLPPVLEGP